MIRDLKIKKLRIKNFRGFERFEMRGLGRVNLLVGANNSGKSSVLEAIQLLSSHGDPWAILSVVSRRGELLSGESERQVRPEADVCHLFRGHVIEPGSTFNLDGSSETAEIGMTADIAFRPHEGSLFDDGSLENEGDLALMLHTKGVPEEPQGLRLSRRGGIPWEVFRKYQSQPDNAGSDTHFIATASMSGEEAVSLFEKIVLTREEDLLVEALQTIEPTIERIASVGSEQRRYYPRGGRGGILVKCAGVEQPIPIGSMGDGLWRMLGLALALVRAEGGILLIDEIDTGLHFTVMSKMWELVNATSERLGVQVFATTHSRDCYESLAAISGDSVSDGSAVTIQRIERDQQQSVPFTEQEIVIAAERGIEVR